MPSVVEEGYNKRENQYKNLTNNQTHDEQTKCLYLEFKNTETVTYDFPNIIVTSIQEWERWKHLQH